MEVLTGTGQNTAWLHWIIKQQGSAVTTVDFLSEARRSGILLPVGLSALGQMSWKDGIYCIHKQEGNKRGSIFCRLPLSLVSGFSVEAVELLVERFPAKEVQQEQRNEIISRLSGDYVEGDTWTLAASIQEICAEVKKAKIAVGSLLVGCLAHEFETMPVPWARMDQMKYVAGFTQFDSHTFLEDERLARMGEEFAATFEVHLPSAYPLNQAPTGAKGGNVQWSNAYSELDEGLGQLDLFAT